MTRQAIATSGAPAAIGPYSQAIAVDGLLFCSGQLGLDPATGLLVDGVEAQAERSLRNLAAVLDAAGLGWADVVKTTIFLADMADFARRQRRVRRRSCRIRRRPGPPSRSRRCPRAASWRSRPSRGGPTGDAWRAGERAALVARYRDGAAAFAAAIDRRDGRGARRPPVSRRVDASARSPITSPTASSTPRSACAASSPRTDPTLPGYDEMAFSRRLHYAERAIGPSVAAMTAARATTLTILEPSPRPSGRAPASTPSRAPYGVEAWLRDYANHPWDHADQAHRVLAAVRGGTAG